MSDFVLVEGDEAEFSPESFSGITFIVPLLRATVKASGKARLRGKKICTEGDEGQVSLPNCGYLKLGHNLPGTGILQIKKLASDQKSEIFTISNKAVLLKGGQFDAKFSIKSPSASNTGDSDKPENEYTGKGQFICQNLKCKSR